MVCIKFYMNTVSLTFALSAGLIWRILVMQAFSSFRNRVGCCKRSINSYFQSLYNFCFHWPITCLFNLYYRVKSTSKFSSYLSADNQFNFRFIRWSINQELLHKLEYYTNFCRYPVNSMMIRFIDCWNLSFYF